MIGLIGRARRWAVLSRPFYLRRGEPDAEPPTISVVQRNASIDPTMTRKIVPTASQELLFVSAMMLVIGGVSAFDVFLSIRYQESLPALELNPCCRWIMNLNPERSITSDAIATFLGLKVLGTVNVLTIIQLLFYWKRTWGIAVAGGVAACQAWLATFLTFAS